MNLIFILCLSNILQQEGTAGDVAIDLMEDALTQWTKPPYIPKRDQLEKEGNIYGYPSTIPGKTGECGFCIIMLVSSLKFYGEMA